jgi:hypothetical protein
MTQVFQGLAGVGKIFCGDVTMSLHLRSKKHFAGRQKPFSADDRLQ